MSLAVLEVDAMDDDRQTASCCRPLVPGSRPSVPVITRPLSSAGKDRAVGQQTAEPVPKDQQNQRDTTGQMLSGQSNSLNTVLLSKFMMLTKCLYLVLKLTDEI
ncbi:hypothetical protein E1301_Tti019729 [Triplophysa tibetana]|uniref:Uncharacterized protein n=1 Tax=Triplophysa tibetana TaxID=1572043 RepID=A0A5A9N915_9TELE|nr:hypothetical protein E1301_Tti019729 [Triplophysa tibetana]